MYKFDVIRICKISGHQSFYKLIINGRCEFDEFCETLKKNKKTESILKKIQTRMEYIAQSKQVMLSSKKYGIIKRPGNDPYPDYEIKEKEYRLYLFKDKSLGKIVVFGGLKKNQKKDIKRLREIKKAYMNLKSKQYV